MDCCQDVNFSNALERELHANEHEIKKLKEKIKGLDEERMASNVRYVQAREYLKEACELIKKGTYFSGHYSDCEQLNDDEECTCGADRFEFEAHIFLETHRN